jgi:hypothetical protein
MKKYIFLFTIFSFAYIFLNYASASSFTQTIILKPGWNIISTPKILDSYSFSASSTSDNFDIYVLNPESPSGWSTMQDLGQTKFEPLFGYFINNKTGQDQNLILNYKQNVSPAERLFKREFKKTGWYSIGIANPTYSKTQYDDNLNDINNPLNILFSIKDKISSVIDFTYGNNSITSVSVSSDWKSANANDLNSLNDFRETKGYGIFINNPENALYEGFQNNEPVPSEGILNVEKNSIPSDGQQLYEGQTVDWIGIKFSAQDLGITVDGFKLVYPQGNNSSPTLVVSKFEIVDESGNVLKTIYPSVFTQDYTTLDYYYYYVTGLNYFIPKGGQKALTIRATAVPNFPSGPARILTLIAQDIRGYDSAGNNIFSSTTISNTVSRESLAASSARFEVSKNSGSPVENNVIADYATGRADEVALLKVDLIARSDRLQLIQLAGSSTAFGVSVSTVYLMDGSNVLDSAVVDSNHSYTFTNLLSQNIWVEKDTTKTLTIAADVTGATTTDATVLATITSVLAKNMLDDIIEQNDLSIIGNPLHVLTEAPMFAKGSTFNVSVVRDTSNTTTTANATLEVMVTAKGGNVKISSSTVFTLLWETISGATTSTTKSASEVRDSSNNLVSQTSGYYVIPVNQTYKFVIQDQKTFPGFSVVRVKVNAITWQNSGNTDITSWWTGRDLVTYWSN